MNWCSIWIRRKVPVSSDAPIGIKYQFLGYIWGETVAAAIVKNLRITTGLDISYMVVK